MIMKIKKRNYIFLAVLMMGIATMITGCVKEDIASNDNGGGVNPTDMNVDELNVKVTADVPTAVLSSFDDNSMGGALVRRLSNTTNGITDGTKMVLIKGEDITSRPITEWFEMAKIYLTGGYIAVEKPHNAHLVSVMEQLSANFTQAEEDMLLKDGISIVRPAGDNTRALSSHVNSFKTRIANIETRAGESTDNNAPVAEMVIFSRNGYYHHATHQGKKYTNEIIKSDGTATTNTIEHNPDYSAYGSGLMADGAAQWLNSRGEAQQVRRAGNRAEGSDYINDLMSADDEYTYDGPLFAVDIESKGGGKVTKPNSQHEIMRIWAAHNMETNKDFYLVQHSSTSAVGGKKDGDERLDPNKTLYRGPYGEDEWEHRGYEGYIGVWSDHYIEDNFYFYGDWYDTSNFSFDLQGEGTVKVEGAVPSTDRNEISTTVTVGEFNGQMTTIGGTITGAAKGGGVTGNVNRGWVNGTFYSLSTTSTVQELTCKKNTEGTKVSWEYREGRNMAEGDNDEHPLIDESLVNDVDVSNQVCWSVENPSGQYKLNMSHQVKMGNICHETFYDHNALNGVSNEKSIILSSAISDDHVNTSYELPIPNRAQQMWNMDVTFPEIAQDGYDKVKPQLTEALKNQFPSVYQPEMQLADQTAESENTIRLILAASRNLLMDKNALQTLREYAQTFKISEFTIKWYSPGTEHNTFHFTVKANGDPEGKDITIEPTDLSKLKNDFMAIDGDVLTGTLAGNYKITIALGATITLKNATINGTNDEAYDWAGITCQGNATIVLADKSKNTVKGFYAWQPGIYVPSGKKLIIQGNTGTLDASSNGQACGIGGNNNQNSGSIEIQGGVITATGGDNDAGIGGGLKSDCGDIVISGGTVTATGGYGAAGIGSGRSKDDVVAQCGNITISGGTVVATAGAEAAAIGAGAGSQTGNITITKGVKSVTATGGIKGSGTVTIEEGANVIQK